jgi:hypothetical protein
MDTNMDIKMDFHCKVCNKYYSSYKSLWNHNSKFHNDNNKLLSTNNKLLSTNINQISTSELSSTNSKTYDCKYCNKSYNIIQSRWKHEQKCKEKNNLLLNIKAETELEKVKLQVFKEEKEILKLKIDNQRELLLKEENKKLKEKLQNINLTKIKEDINDIKNNPPINNQLINIISDKNKKIEELSNNSQIIQPNIEKHIKTFESLTLNNIVITSRSDDNFINATQLCQAGGKQFNDWYRLNTTKQLFNEAESETGIPVSLLVDIKKGNSSEFNQGTWIHPELAIQLAQWLSPKFAIQVSKWIINLFTNGKVEITTKLLTENKLKDQRIKLLEDTYVKKHKREDYPENNVIYILTTKDHIKNRIYIIGKAKNLKNRLSTYNKTCDHQVIYHKKCVDEEILNLVEIMVLNKLKHYQEKANRDRFILPLENDISLFISIIEKCINFYDQYNQIY